MRLLRAEERVAGVGEVGRLLLVTTEGLRARDRVVASGGGAVAATASSSQLSKICHRLLPLLVLLQVRGQLHAARSQLSMQLLLLVVHLQLLLLMLLLMW